MKVIVLAAGTLEHNQVFISDIESALIIPHNGKPLLSAILNELKALPISDVYFAIPERAERTRKLLERHKRTSVVGVHIIEIKAATESNQITTLKEVLLDLQISDDESVLIMYADGIYRFETNLLDIQDQNIVFVDSKPNYSKRYSSVIVDSFFEVSRFVTKKEANQKDENAYIETGAYHFSSLLKLAQILSDVQGMSSTTDIFEHLRLKPRAVMIKEWIDFGHWDLINSHRNMNNPRNFNKIEISKDGQRIIKYSSNKKKNLQEFEFLDGVPATLKHYFPRVFSIKDDRYELEYWPLKSLSELFVYWGLPDPVWRKVACSILAAVKEFESVSQPSQDFNEFNSMKLVSRISNYPEEILSIFNEPFIKINGQKYNFTSGYLKSLPARLRIEDEMQSGTFVHGDLCFSNILHSPDSGIIKFIDPRGHSDSANNVTSIQYDLAKLLHSFHGLYDFIVQDFFEIQSHARNDFSFEILSTPESSNVASIFFQEIANAFPEINLRSLQLIEASLFFSMIPLHSDSHDRQLAFLFRAIQIIDDCY